MFNMQQNVKYATATVNAVDDLLMLSIKASNNKILNKTNKEGRHLVNASQNTTKHHRHGAL
jgi:uncharacterized protein (UPF0333 family)